MTVSACESNKRGIFYSSHETKRVDYARDSAYNRVIAVTNASNKTSLRFGAAKEGR